MAAVVIVVVVVVVVVVNGRKPRALCRICMMAWVLNETGLCVDYVNGCWCLFSFR